MDQVSPRAFLEATHNKKAARYRTGKESLHQSLSLEDENENFGIQQSSETSAAQTGHDSPKHRNTIRTNYPQENVEIDYDDYEAFANACDGKINDAPSSRKFPLPRQGDHWRACHETLDKHDNALCDGLNDDINTLLVFAGLFSATVTAFTIESYQWLQASPEDTTVSLLLQISQQFANANATVASISDGFEPASSSRRINIFWFLSLIVTLMTALIGILCKQWLREYQKDGALPYKSSVALRQLRFEALQYWRVEDLIVSLPVLLQVAVLLFIVGILDLLWTLDHVTAIVISIAAILGFAVVVVTTILPGAVLIFNTHISEKHPFHKLEAEKHLMAPCSFKSPQAWIILRAILFFFQKLSSTPSSWLSTERERVSDTFVLDYYAYRAVYWADENFSQNDTKFRQLVCCLSDLPPNVYHIATEDLVPLDEREVDRSAMFSGTYILFTFLTRNGRMIESMDTSMQKFFAETILRLQQSAPSFLSRSYFQNRNTESTQYAMATKCVHALGQLSQSLVSSKSVDEHMFGCASVALYLDFLFSIPMSMTLLHVGLRDLRAYIDSLKKNRSISTEMVSEYICSRLRTRLIELIHEWSANAVATPIESGTTRAHVLTTLDSMLTFLDEHRIEEPEWWRSLIHEVKMGSQDL